MLEWVDCVYFTQLQFITRSCVYPLLFSLVVGKGRITLTQNVMAFH